MYKAIIIFLFLLTQSYANKINVAVAANVSYAISDLKKEFNKIYPNIKINTTLGSSGKLTAQIKNGAPYDIFISANMKYPQALYDEKLAVIKPVVYAQGSLALFSSKNRDFTEGLEITKDSSIKTIAIANPKTAPYGIATFEALKNGKILNSIKSKFVYGESISQTVSYTISATDLGFIAKSSLYSPKLKRFKKDTNWIELDSNLYTPIDQGIVLLQNSIEKEGAKEFYQFFLSVKAKQILEDFGYKIP